MAYDPGAIDATLAAAVGNEPALVAELRLAFMESAQRAVAMLAAATADDEWRSAAARLRGLAASFGAVRLMALASEAADAPFDAGILARIRRSVTRL